MDVWFRLLDVRRIVADDTLAVIQELKRLRNVRYHDRPVSLYGGMTELPLVVTRQEDVAWFGDREALLEGQLWAERDAENRTETERMARELRDNLIGPELWAVLEPTTRTFLASAEAVFRARREDPAFDYSAPAAELAKAVETELNALIFPATARLLRDAAPAEREIVVEGRRLDLGGAVPHQSLGTVRGLLTHGSALPKTLRAAYAQDANSLLGELPRYLEPLVKLRNPAAHSEAVAREVVAKLRADVLGIGCEGLIVRLARAKLRGGGRRRASDRP